MDRIKVIAERNVTLPIYDEQGNGFFRTLNTDLLQKILGENQVNLKIVSHSDEENCNRRIFFQFTVEVIEALLSDRVHGVVVVLERAFIKELAFYISLFTANYDKPIIIYSTATEKYIYTKDFKQVEKVQQSSDKENIRKAIQVAGEQKYGKSQPLTVVNQSVLSILSNHYLHNYFLTQAAKAEKINSNDQSEKQTNYPSKNYRPRNKSFTGHKSTFLARQRAAILSVGQTGQDRLHKPIKNPSLSGTFTLAKHIAPMPVIPEKVMSMKVNLTTSDEKIIHYAKFFPGIVLEIDHLNILSLINRSLQIFKQNEIPFIITLNNSALLQAKRRREDTAFAESLAGAKFSVSYLHTLDAEILLGILIAQGKSWQAITEVISLTNIHR